MLRTAPMLGYCTNVHAGSDWGQTRANLEEHAAAVKRIISPAAPLPVGLWLPHNTVTELLQRDGEALAQCCDALGLLPFTFNGFPFGNFHQPVVKHAVYEPAWDQPQRVNYTMNLAKLHASLADQPCERSISTLPIGWGDSARAHVDVLAAVANLRHVARELARLHDETGVLVHVDLEPEPGCIIERSEDIVALFDQLLDGSNDAAVRTHLRVCHDICHAAVMYEDQAAVMARYRAAGIRVGKVHVSTALRLDLHTMTSHERQDAMDELRVFAEDRYLHQTMIDRGDGYLFHEDLPEALRDSEQVGDAWRVHYHMPIFLEALGRISTTQADTIACLNAITQDDDIHHFEVETYTWNVLPEAMRSTSLAESIARELRWVQQHTLFQSSQQSSGEDARP